MKNLDRLDTLVAIMDRLRDPGGCPWDREQSFESLRGYLLEECHEAAEALDRGDLQGLREELGDLLFQIVFLSRIAAEREEFSISDVIRGIAEKMIRRHPHVFGSARADTPEQVVEHWERIKREEKKQEHRPRRVAEQLESLPAGLPPMLKARRLGERAAGFGFDWERPEQVLDKIEEEIAECRDALTGADDGAIRDEIGDLLFATVMFARQLDVDPDAALSRTNGKFVERLAWMERELEGADESVEGASPERLEALWDRAKRELKRP